MKRLLLLIVFLFACSPSLPESYGVYVQVDHDYRELPSGSPAQRSSDLPAELTFLVFDKRIASGNFALQDVILILDRKYVRKEVEMEFSEGQAEMRTAYIRDVREFTQGSQTFPVKFQPVEGSTEAVAVVPQTQLAPGLYWLKVFGNTHPFSVGLGTEAGAMQGKTNCVDRSLKAIRPSRFSSSQLERLPRSAEGNMIFAHQLQPCSGPDRPGIAEELIGDWWDSGPRCMRISRGKSSGAYRVRNWYCESYPDVVEESRFDDGALRTPSEMWIQPFDRDLVLVSYPSPDPRTPGRVEYPYHRSEHKWLPWD